MWITINNNNMADVSNFKFGGGYYEFSSKELQLSILDPLSDRK
jgi:hypothetical protein